MRGWRQRCDCSGTNICGANFDGSNNNADANTNTDANTDTNTNTNTNTSTNTSTNANANTYTYTNPSWSSQRRVACAFSRQIPLEY